MEYNSNYEITIKKQTHPLRPKNGRLGGEGRGGLYLAVALERVA
jgi:hypothetical protein